MRRSAPLSLAALLGSLLVVGLAPGQPVASSSAPVASSGPPAAPSGPPADPAEAARKAEARAAFERGLALLSADSVEKALEQFARSRALFPNKSSTINAALCLDRLGRFDEALELYEELVATYARALSEEDRVGSATAMARLRGQVGSLAVSSNVTGIVVVDGRERGRLPLQGPVRVLPGSHLLRVIKDGHRSFEQRLDVALGQTVQIDAQLRPLEASGGLRVEDAALPGAEVLVDGVVVGQSPWEGTLAPGPHVVSSRRDGQGSTPTLAQVLQGQTALLRLKARPLGPEVRVRVTPESAELRLGDVPLGKGRWQGSLPVGQHALSAHEDGYHTAAHTLSVVDGAGGGDVRIELQVDEQHPRWPRRPEGKVHVGLSTFYAFGGGLGGGAGGSCSSATSCDRGLLGGPAASLWAAYELPFGLSVEASLGYLSLSQSLRRTVPRSAGVGPSDGVSYALDDLLRFRGPWLGGGVGYVQGIGGRWSLKGRLLGGVVLARSADSIAAAVSTPGGEERATVDGSGSSVSSTPLFVWPDVSLLADLGGFDVGLSLGALVVATQGPSLPLGAIKVFPNCTTPQAPGCVADTDQLTSEKAHGPFVIATPQLSLSRVF